MPRTVFPVDSASQVSTNRGSLLGRQNGQQGNLNRNGISGSMLGRASLSENAPHAGAARHNGRAPAPSTLLGRQPGQQQHGLAPSAQQYARGQGMSSMAPIREQSAVGSSLSERNMNQLNQSFRAMNVSPGVKIDINNKNNHQETSQPLDRRLQSDVQLVRHAQFNSQPAFADESVQHKRFIILSWTNIPRRLLGELCKVFQVRSSKVRGWLEEGLIRTDLQKWHNRTFPYDIELLTPQLTSKDIEKWDNFVRGYDDDRELRKAIGAGGWSYPKFERDFSRASSSRGAPRPAWIRGYSFDPRCPLCYIRGRYCGHVPLPCDPSKIMMGV